MHSLVQLSSDDAQSSELVGTKAAVLAKLLKLGFSVPPGWCLPIDVHASVRESGYSIFALPDMQEAFRSLLAGSRSGAAIVRSSGRLEDSEPFLFPGTFRSIHSVTCYENLRDAILACMKSADSDAAGAYCKLHGMNVTYMDIGILVQEQLVVEWAGVAFSKSPLRSCEIPALDSVLVEAVKGPSSEMMAGGPVQAAFTLQITHDAVNATRLTSVQNPVQDGGLEGIVKEVAVTAKRIEHVFGVPQDVEWAYSAQGLWVVQARNIPTVAEGSAPSVSEVFVTQSTPAGPVLPGDEEIGLKGAAMEFFVETGLFSNPVIFLKPHANLDDLDEQFSQTDLGDSGITVRFSYRDEIGLPRFFASSKKQALQLLKGTWKADWLGIVHPYMRVRRSFELYLAPDHWVVEHIPGVWESDARLSPDVLIEMPNSLRLLRMKGIRVAKFPSPTETVERQANQETLETLIYWARRIRSTVPTLRLRLAPSLPLNIHFIEDEHGRWQFLNIRRTRPIVADFGQGLRYHVITSVDDIRAWDGEKPLLISVSVDRGQESLITQVASALPPSVKRVYVAFGIMSHPAMVLREVGIETVPAYSSHDLFELPIGV